MFNQIDDDKSLHMFYVLNPKTSSRVLERICGTQDFDVASLLAEHPNTNHKVLETLVNTFNNGERESFRNDILRKLMFHRAMSEELFVEVCSTNKNMDLLVWLAQHPDTLNSGLLALSKRMHLSVIIELLDRDNAPVEMYEFLFTHAVLRGEYLNNVIKRLQGTQKYKDWPDEWLEIALPKIYENPVS